MGLFFRGQEQLIRTYDQEGTGSRRPQCGIKAGEGPMNKGLRQANSEAGSLL
jgi:hypothetical protein